MSLGDTKYVYREGENFQYVCKEDYPFYTALVSQGYSSDVAAQEGKTRFPGSNLTNETPIY